MKLLLISDIHFGVKKNSEFFLNLIKSFFINQIIPVIEKEDIDQLWILGDLFDDKFNKDILMENVAISILRTLLKNYKSLEIKILIGNHDIYYKDSLKVHALKPLEKINSRLDIISTVKEYDLNGFKILAVPWIIDGSENWIHFTKIINEYEETNIKKYNLCMGHFEINGFNKTNEQIEENGLSQSMFDAFEEVYSGHFHIKGKHGHINYLGSPYEITWNDFGSQKGITVYDTDTKTSKFIENTISPKHKHVNISSIIKEKELLNTLDNNIVKFHIDQSIEEDKLVNILNLLDKKNLFNLQILDERIEDLDNDYVDIDTDFEKDELKYGLDYIEQTEHPEDIDIKELKNRFILLHKTIMENKK